MTDLVPVSEHGTALEHFSDSRVFADFLGVSLEAVELCRASLFLDLHIDTLIPPRLWGYDVFESHGPWFGGRFFGHLDLPRMSAVGIDGAMWSITTNPFRTSRNRFLTFQQNLARFTAQVDAHPNKLHWVRTAKDLEKKVGIGVLLSIQGGNALEAAPDAYWAELDGRLTRVTLVHLTNACYGATNAPWHRLRRHKGLTPQGDNFVQRLNEHRIFVDLAHIHPDGFWRALDVHEPSLPPIVTHTGVCGVAPHWRNIDDAQIKAIASRGGVVGIMAHAGYLKRPGGPRGVEMIVEHIEHVIRVGGPSACAIGTDFDGAIIPPRGFRSGLMYPKLVDLLLKRGYKTDLIEGVLGGNFLSSFRLLRPEDV